MDEKDIATQRIKIASFLLKSCNVFNVKNLVCETPHGHFMIDIKDCDISRHILEFGEYGYQEMILWFNHLSIKNDSNIFIDIGANIGTTSVPLAYHHHFKRIFSFEPEPKNFKLLDFNIKKNDLDHIIIHKNIAIGDKNGIVTLELSNSNFGDHRVQYQNNSNDLYDEQKRKTIEVSISTLDSVFKHGNIEIDQVSLIKSDTQGNEGHVLRGAKNILEHRIIPWVIEFWPYGLLRTDINKKEFCELITNSFSNIIEIEKNNPVNKYNATYVYNLFEKYTGASWCNLILIP